MSTEKKESQCDGKTRYASKTQAKSGVRILRDCGEHVHPYICKFCRGWHVGHRERSIK